MPWSIDLLSLDGSGVIAGNAPFRSARVVWAADGSGALEVNLARPQLVTNGWVHGQRRVQVKNPDGDALWEGWLTRLERSGKPSDGPDGQAFRAAGLGLGSILAKRVIVGDVSFVETNRTDVVEALLAHMAGQAYDATDFTADVTGVSTSVTRYYCDGDVLQDIIDELANTSDGGFGYTFEPGGVMRIVVGGIGTDLTGSYTLDETAVQDWSVTGETESVATYVMGIGDAQDDQPCGAPVQETFDALRSDYGRLEAVVTSDENTEGAMLAVAEEELRARMATRYNVRATWLESRAPWEFGTVWIGDTIQVDTGTEFEGVIDMRCTSVSLSFEPGKPDVSSEFVEMEFESA